MKPEIYLPAPVASPEVPEARASVTISLRLGDSDLDEAMTGFRPLLLANGLAGAASVDIANLLPQQFKNLPKGLPKTPHSAPRGSMRVLMPAFVEIELLHLMRAACVIRDCVIIIYECARMRVKTRNDDTGPQRCTCLDFIGDLHPGKLFVHDLARNFHCQFHA